MRVLRRRFDNAIQFFSFAGVAALIGFTTDSPIGLLVAAGLAVLAVRTLRAGVYIDDGGVTVRNVFRTHRVPWEDYERVDIGRAGRPALPTVLLRRREGMPIALWCVQPSTRGKRGPDKLVRLLQEVQTAIGAVRT